MVPILQKRRTAGLLCFCHGIARRAQLRESFEARNGKQPGDPAKLAQAMVHLAGQPRPPMRFAAGAFAVRTARTKFTGMLAELESYEKVSVATNFTG